MTLDLLVRVVGAVDWPQIRAGNRDTYLHLYERFLEEYDPALRRLSGSYYTPHEVIGQMVRLAEEVLVERLERPDGFADPSVVIADPAMGTGGYLQQVVEHVVVARRLTELRRESWLWGAPVRDAHHNLLRFIELPDLVIDDSWDDYGVRQATVQRGDHAVSDHRSA